MQVKIQLGDEWWMLLSDREFSKEELEPFLKVPFVEILKPGERARFLDIRMKKHVKIIMAQIVMNFWDGQKPELKDGSITFIPIR